MQAVILAGGKGERLGKISETIPKPMVKIGQLPILEHQINLLKRYGFKEIVLITHYLSNVIEDYFKDGKKWGVKISYFVESQPLGTTGGIKEIEKKLRGDFLVLYGDKMMDIDLKQLVNFHRQNKSECTILLHPTSHMHDSDLVEINEAKKIIAWHSKPHPDGKYFKNLVSAAVYVMSPKILKHVKRGVKADFGKDIFPNIIGQRKIYGYATAEYIKDVGTPSRLDETQKDYRAGLIARLNKKNKRRAIFIDRDGTINEQVEPLVNIDDFRLLPGSGQAIKKINKSEFISIVITNQPDIAKKIVTAEHVQSIHNKLESLLSAEGAKLDAIYYCPHHPNFDKKCGCRKPGIDLIKKAQKEFNIDLKKSFIIGDSWRDIACGQNAGLATIAVKTGNGCRGIENKIKKMPDYHVKNLLSAVNLILKTNTNI